MDWDLIVVGGGTSGVAAAVSAAKQGCKTLIIEKNSFLGGSQTGSLVTPMMKNSLHSGEILTDGFYNEILKRLGEKEASIVYKDKNPGWFNPEIMKCTLDEFCNESGVEILFDTIPIGVDVRGSNLKNVECIHKSNKFMLSSKYFIDASGDANLAALAGADFQDNNEHQALTLRFNMANINLNIFGEWLNEIDPDSGVSSVYQNADGEIHLSTAYTWDDKGWKLKPVFEKAIEEGVLKLEDSAYFQVFTIPSQKGCLTFNCPRIFSDTPIDPLCPIATSNALQKGREQIQRIAKFCITYLPGFENAYISQIASQLGIRDSRRIEGEYKLTEQDIAGGKKFATSVARSNYPIDVHANDKNKSELSFLNKGDFYEIPLESLIPKGFENLLVTGRSFSATFKAQASARIQPNCISMGEFAGKHVANKLKEKSHV